MKRRHLLEILGLGALGINLSGCSSNCETPEFHSQKHQLGTKPIHWKLITSWPKGFPGLGTAPERFAEMVNTMSGGRLQIKVYGAGEVVSANEVFGAVEDGLAELGHTSAEYWPQERATTSFFTSIPYGLTPQEMSSWLHCGGGMKLWDKLYSEFNLKPFVGGSTGVQMAGWFNRKIETVDDLNGLKMHIPGLGSKVLQKLDGIPVNVASNDLFTALKSGQIDACEWLGPWNDMAFGFYKVAQYYYYPGWHEPSAMLELVINLEQWQALPADLKIIVETAAKANHLAMLDEYTARNKRALQQLKTDHNVNILKLPDDVLKQLRTTADQVVQETVQGNSKAILPVYESFQQFAKHVVEYHRVSEMAYYNARLL